MTTVYLLNGIKILEKLGSDILKRYILSLWRKGPQSWDYEVYITIILIPEGVPQITEDFIQYLC